MENDTSEPPRDGDACAPSRADLGFRLKVAECRGYVVGVAGTFVCKGLWGLVALEADLLFRGMQGSG
jgi:hypothetical protein